MPFTPQSVLEFIKANGPQVPNAIRQALGAQDNFIVGAVLSELVSSRDLALTDLAYGTSKFYYDPAKPEALESLGRYLNEKDQRAFALLKTEKIARHSALTPLNRVAMAQIKDYSRPLKLMTPEGEELFWRYYLVPEEEAMDLIEGRFFGHLKKQVPKHEEPPQPIHASPTPEQAPISSATAEERAVPAKAKHKTTRKAKPAEQATLTGKLQGKATVTSRAPVSASEFSKRIAALFAEKEIALIEDLGSTKSELTAIVSIPSSLGEMRYYCKAKVKKTTGDGDLASAFLEAQHRSLPLLYVSGGTLTRKAQTLAPTLKGTVVMTPWIHGGA